MNLILIRHPESFKNVANQFSSENDAELLTPKGTEESLLISENLRAFISKNKYLCKNIYCANSLRSIETARIIANQLNASVQIEEALRSTKPGKLSGKSEAETKLTHPEFIEQLYLFRCGLFNAYDFKVVEGKEPKKEFEKRVLECLDKIILEEAENIKIIIAHRSSITCILLDFAKQYYNYPNNFSGYIQLDLAKLSIVTKIQTNAWKILRVNCDSSDLNTIQK